jgi:uncharacterized protein
VDAIVSDNIDKRRFELRIDEEVAGFADYRVRDGILVIVHSEIDPAHRGEGLGGTLAAQTLLQLRERGERAVMACPFFARYVAGHPEWSDVVAD